MEPPQPIPEPPATPPSAPTDSLADVFPPRIQAALFLIILALVGVVAWTSFRPSDTPVVAEADAAVRLGRVDVNRADRAELMSLPGVGSEMASRIIAYREMNGPFDGLADLRKVSGIGPATLEKLRPHIVLSWPEQPRAPRTAAQVVTVARTPARAQLDMLIDVNAASLEELQKLPGIGPKLAERIVDTRARQSFAALADLRRVPGIGPKTLEKIKPHVSLGGVATVKLDEISVRDSAACDGATHWRA